MVGIIDYGAGNLRSVQKAVEYLGYDAVISKDREEILSCDRVILPGVGNFGDAALKLKKENLVQTIYDVIEKGTPFLGICLGFHREQDRLRPRWRLRASPGAGLRPRRSAAAAFRADARTRRRPASHAR